METVTGSRLHSSLRFRISLFKLGTGKEDTFSNTMAFMKCCRNTAAWELGRASGQGSSLENCDVDYPRVEKPSWQQAGADAQI